MNYLKNILCDDLCEYFNEYLMVNKDTVYENKKLVIEEILNVIDLCKYINESNKEYAENELFFNNNKIEYNEESFLSVYPFSSINGEYD